MMTGAWELSPIHLFQSLKPEIDIEPESLSQFTTELYLRYFIFDFATQYYWNHPEIKSPSQFVFTDKDYNDFRSFLISRNFSYKTFTETSLNELIDNAKREKYYDLHKDLFSELEKDVAHSLDQDLTVFRPEITELLEEEIIGRYFYDEGAIAWSVKKDEQISKALEVLNNKEKYSSILSGKTGSVLITSKGILKDNSKVISAKSKILEAI
jgi:carboxyl-terminal processing protease